jgi:queuine/archaeosine tRNA-ribosyltransferase
VCIACFCIGAKVGQTVSKGETIETPTVNPVKAFKEHRARQETEMEQSRMETILQNIDNYDGTSHKQEDVPKR